MLSNTHRSFSENVLFLASGSFAVESTFDPDRSVDWEPCTVAIIHLAPFRGRFSFGDPIGPRQ